MKRENKKVVNKKGIRSVKVKRRKKKKTKEKQKEEM